MDPYDKNANWSKLFRAQVKRMENKIIEHTRARFLSANYTELNYK